MGSIIKEQLMSEYPKLTENDFPMDACKAVKLFRKAEKRSLTKYQRFKKSLKTIFSFFTSIFDWVPVETFPELNYKKLQKLENEVLDLKEKLNKQSMGT